MMKWSFFGFAKSQLKYAAIDETLPEPVAVAPLDKITLFIDQPYEPAAGGLLKPGDAVKKGQRLSLTEDAGSYVLASRSGQIEKIEPFLGIGGRRFTAVTIHIDDESNQMADEGFKDTCQTPTLKNAVRFLAGLPGKPDLSVFCRPDRPVKSIVVLGVDGDLLSATNQYFVKNGIVSIKTGIDILRDISGIHDVILVVPRYLAEVAGASGAAVKTVDADYPSAHRQLIIRHILSGELPADNQPPPDHSVAFFSAEAVTAIGAAYNTGKLPLSKVVYFISKDGNKRLVSVPVGTPVRDILAAFDESLSEGDRVIFGGPMMGVSVYSDQHPVLSDTDTIMIQDRRQILESSDAPCINCGECVRVCPTNVPVNMLIRYLQAGRYEEAAEQCDLDSCIECGFCSYVCESRIPIFQHIHLAKHALAEMSAAEGNNG